MKKSLTNKNGFTLLELILALTILTVLTVYSSQTIQTALRSKLRIQEQIDEMSAVRNALRIMEKDIQLTYHYHDIELEFNKELRKQKIPPSAKPDGGDGSSAGRSNGGDNSGSSGSFENPYSKIADLSKDPNRQSPETHFLGKENEVHFVTLNSFQQQENAKQADYVEVGYTLSSCRKPGKEGPSQNCLVRRMSPYADLDVSKGGTNIILLDSVSEFKLRYSGIGKQDWVSTWDTKNGDATEKSTFPTQVEISLTVEKEDKGKKKKISMQIVVPIHFPNNNTKTTSNAATTTPNPGQPSQDNTENPEGPGGGNGGSRQ